MTILYVMCALLIALGLIGGAAAIIKYLTEYLLGDEKGKDNKVNLTKKASRPVTPPQRADP